MPIEPIDAVGADQEIADLRRAVLALRAECTALRAARAENAATIDALGRTIATLVQQIALETAKAHATARGLLEMERKATAADIAAETQRLKLVALATEVRWQNEDLRKTIDALAERLLPRGPAAAG